MGLRGRSREISSTRHCESSLPLASDDFISIIHLINLFKARSRSWVSTTTIVAKFGRNRPSLAMVDNCSPKEKLDDPISSVLTLRNTSNGAIGLDPESDVVSPNFPRSPKSRQIARKDGPSTSKRCPEKLSWN